MGKIDFSNLTIADISNLVRDNERLKKENEALKKHSDDDNDYIVYVTKDGKSHIKGSFDDIIAGICALAKNLSETTRMPFHTITSEMDKMNSIYDLIQGE